MGEARFTAGMGMRCAYRVNCSTAIYVELCDCDPSRKPPAQTRGAGRVSSPSATAANAAGGKGAPNAGLAVDGSGLDARGGAALSATRAFAGILGRNEEKAGSKMRTKFERAAAEGQSTMRTMYAREDMRRH